MRYMVTEGLGAAMEPQVARAKWYRGGQPPQIPDRAFFEALLHVARTGIPWRNLRAEFGNWDAVYNWFRRWVPSGGRSDRDPDTRPLDPAGYGERHRAGRLFASLKQFRRVGTRSEKPGVTGLGFLHPTRPSGSYGSDAWGTSTRPRRNSW